MDWFWKRLFGAMWMIFISKNKRSSKTLWRGGVVVRASDLQPRDRRSESRPLCFTYNRGQVVHTHVPLFTKQYKIVSAQAGR